MPGVGTGNAYKYVVLGADGQWREKADPMAAYAEVPPDTASKVFESSYEWGDADWMDARPAKQHVHEPMSVYELHLGVVAARQDLGASSPTSCPATSPTSASPTSS